MQAVDRAGRRYGRLVAIRPSEERSGGHVRWLCRCDCGNEKIIDGGNLSAGFSMSCGCSRMAIPGRPARNRVYDNYRRSAGRRGYAWELGGEEFDKLAAADCAYCGSPPGTVQVYRSHRFTYNGIDRVNNSLGYMHGNVVPCCEICNRAKGAKSLGEFLAWISRLISHRRGLNEHDNLDGHDGLVCQS